METGSYIDQASSFFPIVSQGQLERWIGYFGRKYKKYDDKNECTLEIEGIDSEELLRKDERGWEMR